MNTLSHQHSLAHRILRWHGGQSSGLYAVGSCMLSDAEQGRRYDAAQHRGHADDGESLGAFKRALRELRKWHTPQDEAECRALAGELEAYP